MTPVDVVPWLSAGCPVMGNLVDQSWPQHDYVATTFFISVAAVHGTVTDVSHIVSSLLPIFKYGSLHVDPKIITQSTSSKGGVTLAMALCFPTH